MTLPRLIAFAYAVMLFFAAALNYIPGICDDQGRAFGVFELDLFDDGLHIVSGLWALAAAIISNRAARIFLVIFGAAYLGDGVLGFFTGYGYLDFGLFKYGNAGTSFTFIRLAANLPHIVMGAFALFAGLKFGRE